jgi:hypothetical protein
MSHSITVEEIVAELRTMLDLGRTSPSVVRRTQRQPLTVAYEFVDADGVHPYHLRIAAGAGTLTAGALSHDEADIVVRTSPTAMHRLLNGDLGGREAVVSGILDLRKAPSMPKLLVLRALFNTYLKAHKRGALEGA